MADGITETEILATAIVDTRIGIREDEMEGIEEAEVAEDAGDVAEETEIDPKATMHAQFMEDTSGVNVSLTLTGITTDKGTVTVANGNGQGRGNGSRRGDSYHINNESNGGNNNGGQGNGSNNNNNNSSNNNDGDRRGGNSNNSNNNRNNNDHYLTDIGMPDWNQE